MWWEYRVKIETFPGIIISTQAAGAILPRWVRPALLHVPYSGNAINSLAPGTCVSNLTTVKFIKRTDILSTFLLDDKSKLVQ